MTIQFNTVSNTPASTGASSLSSPGTSLTAEGLLIYCQTQLASLGGDIKEMMNEQRANLARKDAIATAKTAMSKYQPPTNDAEMAQVREGMQKAIDSLPPGDPARVVLEKTLSDLQTAYNRTSLHTLAPGVSTSIGAHVPQKSSSTTTEKRIPLNETWYESKMQALGDAYDEIKGDTELQMIQLQANISARSTAIQLTTSMLSKLDQGYAGIIKNM